MTETPKQGCDFWMPLLDVEYEALRRNAPELLAETEAEQRQGVWWIHLRGRVVTEAQARANMRLVIAEEVAGHAIHDLPKPN